MTQDHRPVNEIQMTLGDFFQQIVVHRMKEIKTPRTVLLWVRKRFEWSLTNPPMTVLENIKKSRRVIDGTRKKVAVNSPVVKFDR